MNSNHLMITGGIILVLILILISLYLVFKKKEEYAPTLKEKVRDVVRGLRLRRRLPALSDPLGYITGEFLDPQSAARLAQTSRRMRETVGKKLPILRTTGSIFDNWMMMEFLNRLKDAEERGVLLPNQKEKLQLINLYPINTYPENLQDVYNRRVSDIHFFFMFNGPLFLTDAEGVRRSLLPTGLKRLNVGTQFNQPIDFTLLPSLGSLTLGFKFQQPLEIPINHPLKELIFEGENYNYNITLPTMIQKLDLPKDYKGVIDFSNFEYTDKPLFIKELTIGRNPLRLPRDLKIGTLTLKSLPENPLSPEAEVFINYINSLNKDRLVILFDKFSPEIEELNYHVDANNLLQRGPNPNMTQETLQNLMELQNDNRRRMGLI